MSDPSIVRRSASARLFYRATRILAMRDHSEQELRRKLLAVFPEQKEPAPDPTDIEHVIARCLELNWLDDDRFTRQFIASRACKGYGPLRVYQELQQRGIARDIGERAMAESHIDWSRLAWELATKKYGCPLPVSFPQKAKIQRFLLYRGFIMENIQDIYRNFSD